MNLGPSTGTHPRGLQRGRGAKGRIHPCAWLAAGALVLGAAAVAGSGNAHADAVSGASASEAAGRAGPAAKPSVRDSAQRGRGAVTAAKTVSASAAVPVQSPTPAFGRGAVTAGSARSGKAPSTTAAPSCETPSSCGYASFQYTGAPQTWAPPAGVNTAYFHVVGGNGFPFFAGGESVGLAIPISATITLNDGFFPTPVTATTIIVGGDGVAAINNDGGAGGYNGGGSGGSGSDASVGGSGGGGATTVAISAGGPPGAGIVLVGGGGGGGGGEKISSVSGSTYGGGGGFGGSGPASGGVWAGSPGEDAPGDNGGGGGAGSNQATSNGGSGEDADDLTGNAGGGGGGGGWQGGSGGQAGQSGFFGTAGAGGGGGGGSSYANPLFTSNVSLGTPPIPGGDAYAVIQWVQNLTTNLAPMKAGRPTSQQLSAIYANNANAAPTWQVTGGPSGNLPDGLSLSETGSLTGTPTRSGRYQFGVLVNSVDGFASSAVTYSGTVCSRRGCSRR